jgi:hypothetical protein
MRTYLDAVDAASPLAFRGSSLGHRESSNHEGSSPRALDAGPTHRSEPDETTTCGVGCETRSLQMCRADSSGDIAPRGSGIMGRMPP